MLGSGAVWHTRNRPGAREEPPGIERKNAQDSNSRCCLGCAFPRGVKRRSDAFGASEGVQLAQHIAGQGVGVEGVDALGEALPGGGPALATLEGCMADQVGDAAHFLDAKLAFGRNAQAAGADEKFGPDDTGLVHGAGSCVRPGIGHASFPWLAVDRGGFRGGALTVRPRSVGKIPSRHGTSRREARQFDARYAAFPEQARGGGKPVEDSLGEAEPTDDAGAAGAPTGRSAALGFALAAFALRLLPLPSVFLEGRGGGVHFTDSDAYYHARRVLYGLEAFPATLSFDRYLNFPAGAKAIWPPTFDALIAALLWPFGLAGDGAAVEAAIVFVPPMLGAATVYALHRIAGRHFGAFVAHLAAGTLVVLPAHYWYSQLGFVDHHVAVALCSTLAFGLALGVIARALREGVQRRHGVVFGFALALNLLIWPGAILHVSLALGAVLLCGVSFQDARLRRQLLELAGVASLVALVSVAPFSWGNEWPQWGAYSAVVLSNFQPWYLGVLGLSALGCSRVLARDAAWGVPVRVAISLGVGALCVGVSLAGIPELVESVREAGQWLGKSDAFQSLVGESVPLFILHGQFTTGIASSRLSGFVFLFPFAVVLLAWRHRRDPNRAVVYSVLGWAAVFFALTLLQKRFFNSFAVWMSLVMALAAVEVAARLTREATRQRGLAVLVCLLCLLPSFAFYRGPLAHFDRETLASNLRIETNRARREMVDWLRTHTPPTRGYFDPEVEPEYGVLARWGEGHFITYGARRPAVLGNFGDDIGREHFLRARAFFETPLDQASAILDELGVRYVVIAALSESRPTAKQLYSSSGSRSSRYRLVHDVPPIAGTDLPSYKIFEFVEGAVLEGRAASRALVKAALELRAAEDGKVVHRYEEVVQAGPDGRFRLRVAHPTQGHPGGFVPEGRYRVSAGDRETWVEVLPAAVGSGETLRVEGLRDPAAPAP